MSTAPAQELRAPRARPFPWKCGNCGKMSVVPTTIDFAARVKQDGAVHEFVVPDLETPRCESCGEVVITDAADDMINDFLRKKLGLLSPDQIRSNIQKLGLTQQELAEWLDVAPETISRWMTGALIQSSRMNKRLRMFFAFPEAREMLRRLDREPELGMEVNLSPAKNGPSKPAASSRPSRARPSAGSRGPGSGR